MEYYGTDKMKERRELIARLTTKYTLQRFNDNGTWAGKGSRPGMREILYYAMAFFTEGSHEAIQKANQIIQVNIPGYRFCHFTPFVCLQTFCHFEDLMDKETIMLMDEYILKYIDEFMLPELDFVGCNDNFPCMSTAAALLAGQRYGRMDYIEKARERLGQLMQLLSRRGFTSEYTSPTYTPIQALALAEIVTYSNYKDISTMALQAEIRIFADLLMHMHWTTSQLAGAFSRGYPVDTVACPHHASFLYYMLYGDELGVGPVETVLSLEEGLEGMVIHHSADFLKISAMWQALPQYHCPKSLAVWAKKRKMPYITTGTTECISSMDHCLPFLPEPKSMLPEFYENPERVNFLYTYMTEEYALGTSRYAFHNGYQSHGLRLLYRKNPVVHHQRDIGTMFMRYVVNDHLVDWESDQYFDMGNFVSQQHENTAMMLYTPRILHNNEINSLKLTINIGALYNEPDEIWIGECKLENLEGYSDNPDPVWVRDGDVYIMLQPLYPKQDINKFSCTVRRVEKLIEISFINYQGEAKDFDRNDLLKIGNGVAVEVRSKAQTGSFDKFRLSIKPKINDRWFGAIRKCRYENGFKSMEMEYSPRSKSVRFVTQNDMLAEEPRLFTSDSDIINLLTDN